MCFTAQKFVKRFEQFDEETAIARPKVSAARDPMFCGTDASSPEAVEFITEVSELYDGRRITATNVA